MIFCYLIANNQLKCGIIYKTIVMWLDDDKRRINYEWPHYQIIIICNYHYSEIEKEIDKKLKSNPSFTTTFLFSFSFLRQKADN